MFILCNLVFLVMNHHVQNDLEDDSESFNSLRQTRELLTKIEDGLSHISNAPIKFPIIDACRSHDQESSLVEHHHPIRGLKILRESVKRDREVLDKVSYLGTMVFRHIYLNHTLFSSFCRKVDIPWHRQPMRCIS